MSVILGSKTLLQTLLELPVSMRKPYRAVTLLVTSNPKPYNLFYLRLGSSCPTPQTLNPKT